MTFRAATEAINQIRNRGILRPNKFLVQFNKPKTLQQLVPPEKEFDPDNVFINLMNSIDQGELSLWAEQAALPGAALETQPVRRYGYGPVEMKPHTARFTDMDVVFRVDAKDKMVFTFLHTWMRSINEYYYGQGDTLSSNTGVVLGQKPFLLSYKDDYKTDINVTVYDDTGKESLNVLLRDAYPVMIGDTPLHWESKEYLRIPAKFTYYSWKSTTPVPVVGKPPKVTNQT